MIVGDLREILVALTTELGRILKANENKREQDL